MKRFTIVLMTFFFIFCSVLLVGVMKGGVDKNGTLLYQQTKDAGLTGPFESSGSNSRYALIEAMVNSGTFFFSDELASFATPDLVASKGKYFSIFTPGVSFASAPFYILGKFLGVPQLATYMATTLVSLLNIALIICIVRKLGGGIAASFISGFLFLFGTNALTYALTLTQHHWSIFVLLSATLSVLYSPGVLRNILLGLLYGAGLLIDIPNGFIMLPVMFYAAWQHMSISSGNNQKMMVKIKLTSIFLILGLIPLLFTFAWYNKQLTGSYTAIGQLLGRSDYPPRPETQQKQPTKKDPYGPKYPFYSRLQLNGLYILLISNERGWLYYSPVIFIGIAGLFLAAKRKDTEEMAVVILTTAGLTVTIYSSFGDPWGGWAFGPRYLLPATALLSVGVGLAVEQWKNRLIFGVFFLIIAAYGIHVGTMGAFTTTQVPPKQEADHLATFIPYTYAYNRLLIEQGKSGSLVYNVWLSRYVPLYTVVNLYQGLAITTVSTLYIFAARKNRFHL